MLGHEPSPALALALAMGVEARVKAWPGTGHFPRLARLPPFAQLLADTAGWRSSTPVDQGVA